MAQIAQAASADHPATILVRAHGCSKQIQEQLESYANENPHFHWIDCTCPYVKKIHKIAQENSAPDRFFILIGAETHPEAVVCINCGCSFNTSISNDTQKSITQPTLNQKSKLIAGLLGIFLGMFGAHNFYLGHNTKAIVQLCLTLIGSTFTCGVTAIVAAIWGLIEGIQILSGNIKTDADGNPLKND